MVKNRMDAEDISQDVLIRLWNNMGKFKFSSAGSWIMRTTHNLCIDYLRREQSEKKRSVFIDEDTEDRIEDDTINGPEAKTLNKITNEKIKAAIQNLPENLKSVFVLYEIEGFKYREISDVLDIPVNSVKVYILRARKKLQKDLKEYAEYEK